VLQIDVVAVLSIDLVAIKVTSDEELTGWVAKDTKDSPGADHLKELDIAVRKHGREEVASRRGPRGAARGVQVPEEVRGAAGVEGRGDGGEGETER
jgi:hypothetical protein